METFPCLVAHRSDSTEPAKSHGDPDQPQEDGVAARSHTGDAVISVDANGDIIFMNAVAEELTGWMSADALGQPLNAVLCVIDDTTHADIIGALTWRARREGHETFCEHAVLVSRDHREYPVGGSIVAMRDISQRYLGNVLVFRDISTLRRLEQNAAEHGRRDILTGLINRSEFEIRAEELVQDAQLTGKSHAVLFLDVDQFAVVNDTYGRGAGDALLRQLAELLQGKLQPGDTLARLGNDEFGILLFGRGVDDALQASDELLRSIHQTAFVWRAQRFALSVSIGVATIAANDAHATSFLTGADAACARAKKRGGNRAFAYRRDDLEFARKRSDLQWAAGVAKALDDKRMSLDIQPIAPLANTGEHVFYEVLLRMVDEDGKRISPDEFIPAAERYHLMYELDRWVIANAFAALRRRHDAGERSCRFAINLSGHSLSDDRLADYVKAQLIEHDVPPASICFEITETAAVENLTSASAFIDELRLLGCSFALDDFGRGMSSFAHLKNLAVDYLKIDGMFIAGMMDNEFDQAMVRAFNWIGHVRGLKTIAEHVESEAMLINLHKIGVDYVQGFGIARPAPMN